jgi:hypothetical protein
MAVNFARLPASIIPLASLKLPPQSQAGTAPRKRQSLLHGLNMLDFECEIAGRGLWHGGAADV